MHNNTLDSIIIQQLFATVTGKRCKIGMMVLIEDFPHVLLLLRNTGNQWPVSPGTWNYQCKPCHDHFTYHRMMVPAGTWGS